MGEVKKVRIGYTLSETAFTRLKTFAAVNRIPAGRVLDDLVMAHIPQYKKEDGNG